MANPRSQKADKRPISFRLEDGQGGSTTVPLVIRPEDLNRTEPSLQSFVPTFGGAFMDDWGLGISTIQISGNTGWGSGKRPPGEEEFKKVHNAAWTGWHAARKAAVEDGRDVKAVKLLFIDELDEITAVVAPGSFALKRNRSRPLLMMYQISMTVLSDDIAPPAKDPLDFTSIGKPDTIRAGLASLGSSVGRITAAASRIRSFVDGAVADPLHQIMGLSTGAFSKVISVVSAARGVVNDEASHYIGIATDLSLLGRNAFNTYNAVATLPDFLKHEVSAVASSYQNAFCVLRNAFRKVQDYPDYDSVYGASNCSSTVGGSPLSLLADRNPWEVILPSRSAVASVTPEARANIELFKSADPVLRPMSLSELTSRVTAVGSGVSFPWL